MNYQMDAQPHICCPECKYDLHGLFVGKNVRCPECGGNLKLEWRTKLQWQWHWRHLFLIFMPVLTIPIVTIAVISMENLSAFFLWIFGGLICVIWGSVRMVHGGRPNH